jgi:hypothetical protein
MISRNRGIIGLEEKREVFGGMMRQNPDSMWTTSQP